MIKKKTLLLLAIPGLLILTVGSNTLDWWVPTARVYYLAILLNMALDLIWAAAFCAIAWFMLVKNMGDKTASIVMLTSGLLGLFYSLLSFLGFLSVPAAIIVVPHLRTGFMCALFVAFGLAGLLTKRQAG